MLTDEQKAIIEQEAKAGGTASFTTPEALEYRAKCELPPAPPSKKAKPAE